MIYTALLQSGIPEWISKAWPPLLGAIGGFGLARLNLLWDESRRIKIEMKEVRIQPGPRGMVGLQNFPMGNNVFYQGMLWHRLVVKNKSTITRYMHDPRFTFYLNNKPVAGFSFSGGHPQAIEVIELPARKELTISKDFEFWASASIEELQQAKLVLSYMVGERTRSLDVLFKFIMVRYAN